MQSRRTSQQTPGTHRPLKRSPEPVRIRMLGGFGASVGFRTIEESARRLRKGAALVKLLALSPGHLMHREQVMDALWPELGNRAATNNMRHVLHVARRVLDPTSNVEELRRLCLTLLVELAILYEERGEYQRGVEALRTVVAEEPTLEEAHAGLMRLYAFSERRGEAMAQLRFPVP